MCKKFLINLFLVMAISILLTSCTTQETANNAVQNTVQAGNTSTDGENKDNLSIYLCKDVIGDYLKEALDEYNKNNKNVQIVSQDIGDFEAFGKKITTELLAGDGPDIVVFNSSTFSSIHKAVASGAFYDLNSLINEDTEFKLSDYNDKVMEAGVFNGKRYLMPLNYCIFVLTTTKEKLDRDKFSIEKDGAMTWREISEISNEYMNNRNDKFFFPYVNPIEFFISSGSNFVDVDKKVANIKSSEFIELLDAYKKIYNATIPYEQQKDKDFEYVDSKSLVMIDNSFMSRDTTLQYKMENKIVYPVEMMEMKGKIAASPYIIAGINSKCKQKKAAFGYIKLLLSEKMQVSYKFHLVPVNKAAFMADKTENTSYNALAKELSENIGKCEINENKIYSIIDQELNDFLNNKKTAEQTAAAIQDKVNIFLNE